MRLILSCCILSLLLVGCGDRYKVSGQYRALVEDALLRADSNAVELKRALKEVPDNQLEGMSFLIAYMPQVDLTTLSADFLLENVAWAYKAKADFPWAQALPDSIFLNDVLPYASFDEQRDNWRKDFYSRFAPMVKDAKNAFEAIEILNAAIKDEVKVEYSTKRKRACQGPHESMEQGLASCTGLSILLTDALRAVGIPSRLAGTPLWISKEGNHNWNEVWVDGTWYFTEYYPSGLNKSWFLERAGKGDPANPVHAVYATSFKPAETHFPLVWKRGSKEIHAYNVTQRYIDLYQLELAQQSEGNAQGSTVIVGILAFNTPENNASDNRVATTVEIKVDGKLYVKGTTAGPLQDMNDYFKVQLNKGQQFTIGYTNAAGKSVEKEEKAGQENSKIFIIVGAG